MIYKLGAKKDKNDDRDRKKVYKSIFLPSKAFVPNFPKIKDQGQTNSCTGHAATWFWEQILSSRNIVSEIQFSPYYNWFLARKEEGTSDKDEGVQIRSIMSSLNKFGATPLFLWDYSKSISEEPQEEQLIYGQAFTLPEYQRCEDVQTMKYSISIEGQSVVVGVPVFSNWASEFTRTTGVIEEFDENKDFLEGYHAITLCGYNDDKKQFKFANSWGESWGFKGFGFIPYSYFYRFFCDAWTANFNSLPDIIN